MIKQQLKLTSRSNALERTCLHKSSSFLPLNSAKSHTLSAGFVDDKIFEKARQPKTRFNSWDISTSSNTSCTFDPARILHSKCSVMFQKIIFETGLLIICGIFFWFYKELNESNSTRLLIASRIYLWV